MNEDKVNQMFEGRWRIKGNYGRINSARACLSFDEFYNYIKDLCRDFFTAGILLGQSETSGLPPKVINAGCLNTMEHRSKRFFMTFYTSTNIQKYGQQMLQDFYEYWSEPNPSHTKMRFELQKTWDVNRRLARWARNNFNGNRNGNSKPTTDEQLSKLADILTD
jgi:hypothetical protein